MLLMFALKLSSTNGWRLSVLLLPVKRQTTVQLTNHSLTLDESENIEHTIF